MIRDELRSLEEQAGKSKPLIDEFIACFEFDTKPEYLAELAEERRECEANSQAISARTASNVEAETETQTIWGNVSEECQPIRCKQTKAKAARSAVNVSGSEDDGTNPHNLSDNATEDEAEQPEILPSIAVKQDSLAVFHRMYPAESSSAQGTVRWLQFVQAMTEAGFTATAANGSAVNFGNERSSIAFHKPHPEPTIEPIRLHGWAKRMRKRFGWSRERFVLREKRDG